MGLRERTVSDVMTRDVVTLGEDDCLDLADDIMSLGRVRHMPVVAGRRLVGIVSNRDLLAASLTKALDYDARERRQFLRAVDVREVMTDEVVTVGPGATLSDVARLMMARQIGSVAVVEDGDLLGLVTETDLLRAAYADDSAEAAPGERFERELDELRRIRDELKVQVHLGAAEASDLWADLERRWQKVEARVEARVGEVARAPLDVAEEVAEELIEQLRSGYRRIRELL